MCIRDRFRTLKQGSKVSYELTVGPKGMLAQNIQPITEEDALVQAADALENMHFRDHAGAAAGRPMH